MTFETLEFAQDGFVGVLTINRPESMNALNNQVITDLESFVESAPSLGLRALVLTGAGDKSFVAGADIKEMKDFGPGEALKLAKRGQFLFRRIEQLPFVTIAAVNGFALGGGMELALSCDMIFASEKAKFGLPEVSLGLIPGYGGTQRLARCIGPARAKMLACSGEMFKAEQMLTLGLVAQLAAPEELLELAKGFAGKIAAKAPMAVQAVKTVLMNGFDQTLDQGMVLEAEAFSKIFGTADKAEGVNAFIEKRKAEFTGK